MSGHRPPRPVAPAQPACGSRTAVSRPSVVPVAVPPRVVAAPAVVRPVVVVQPAMAPRAVQPARPTQARTVQPMMFHDRERTHAPVKTARGEELVNLRGDEFVARNPERQLQTRPNGTYNFVRVHGERRSDQHTFISSNNGHVQLSGGRPVVYAGTAKFDAGRLQWWSNFSGHYQPVAAFRGQAQMPEDKFVPWQKLQMGGQSMQRGLFRDQRPKAPDQAKPAAKPAAPPPAPPPVEKPVAAMADKSPAATPPGPAQPAPATKTGS